MKTHDWIDERQETCVENHAREQIDQEYVDSYAKRETKVVYKAIICFGMIFGGLLCIIAIYYVIWAVLSLFNH